MIKMTVKELSCSFNMPNKLKGIIANGEEVAHALPPYAPVETYLVDKYPGCPDNWMHGSDIASSYFIGVEEDKGMWLNFNDCLSHKYHIAAVLSIQGINPITGQKTDKLRLEKYKTNCPVHDKPFQSERFCPDCKYNWPAQNYISTTGTPYGLFWLDGFRTPDGKVRQYIFTAEKMRGIANQLIGKDRIFAIGIAFYLSKKEKKIVPQKEERIGTTIINTNYFPTYYENKNPIWNSHDNSFLEEYTCCDTKVEKFDGGLCVAQGCSDITTGQSMSHKPRTKFGKITTKGLNPNIEKTCGSIKITKQLEVGAGALIEQQVYEDPEEISFWRDEPYGMIYINYCDKETLQKILNKGIRQEEKEGFMKNLKIGS